MQRVRHCPWKKNIWHCRQAPVDVLLCSIVASSGLEVLQVTEKVCVRITKRPRQLPVVSNTFPRCNLFWVSFCRLCSWYVQVFLTLFMLYVMRSTYICCFLVLHSCCVADTRFSEPRVTIIPEREWKLQSWTSIDCFGKALQVCCDFAEWSLQVRAWLSVNANAALCHWPYRSRTVQAERFCLIG